MNVTETWNFHGKHHAMDGILDPTKQGKNHAPGSASQSRTPCSVAGKTVPCLEGPPGFIFHREHVHHLQPPTRWSTCLTQLGWDRPCLSGTLTGPTRVMGLGLAASSPHRFFPVLLLVPDTPGPGPLSLPWGPPSLSTLGKHLHFLFFFFHGQLIIIDNVAFLFSKSLVHKLQEWLLTLKFYILTTSNVQVVKLPSYVHVLLELQLFSSFLGLTAQKPAFSQGEKEISLGVKVYIFKWLLQMLWELQAILLSQEWYDFWPISRDRNRNTCCLKLG